MNMLDNDRLEFDALSQGVAQWCSTFQQQLPQRSVAVMEAPGLAEEPLPESGSGAASAFAQFQQQIAPYLSGSAGPRYLGFVTGGSTPAAMLGDWLVAATDQNVFVPGDSISSSVELQALAWLRELFYLPDDFDGILTTGATASNILGALTG